MKKNFDGIYEKKIYKISAHFVQLDVRRKIKIGVIGIFFFGMVLGLFSTVLVPKRVQLYAATPDFQASTIKKMKGVSKDIVVAQVDSGGQDRLLILDAKNGKVAEGFNVSIASDYPLAVKGDGVFWLSSSKDTLFIFDLTDKTLAQKTIPSFDPTKGERAEVKLWNIPWEVIISKDNFYFSSKKTGEVFSDENTEGLEGFRQKFNLDLFLREEDLLKLGFEVKENE